MNAARQMLRRFGRATILRTCSAADYYINATMSIKSDPFKLPETDERSAADIAVVWPGYGGADAFRLTVSLGQFPMES